MSYTILLIVLFYTTLTFQLSSSLQSISCHKRIHQNNRRSNLNIIKSNIEDDRKSFDRNRLILSGLSISGFIETSYLTISKLTSIEVSTSFCSGQSCSSVLQSPYSEIPFIHLPISALAVFAYGVILYLTKSKDAFQDTESMNNSLLLFTSTSIGIFSVYLMYILTSVIKESCPYCYLSAFLSISIALVSWNSKLVSNNIKSTIITSTSALMTSLFSIFLYYTTGSIIDINEVNASTAPIAQLSTEEIDKYAKNIPPMIKKASSPDSLKLAERLKSLNTRMFGAYWCSHCNNQKQILGREAFEMIDYIECDREGFNNQYKFCRESKVFRLIYYLENINYLTFYPCVY